MLELAAKFTNIHKSICTLKCDEIPLGPVYTFTESDNVSRLRVRGLLQVRLSDIRRKAIHFYISSLDELKLLKPTDPLECFSPRGPLEYCRGYLRYFSKC